MRKCLRWSAKLWYPLLSSTYENSLVIYLVVSIEIIAGWVFYGLVLVDHVEAVFVKGEFLLILTIIHFEKVY